jgi:riboflavin kinase / FMN adenylyltransferase
MMNILSSVEELSRIQGPIALAIGMFDGVHRGHREVIRGAIDYAQRNGGTAVVLTFDPHPLQVLRPEAAPRLLCSTRHKLRLMAALGVHHTLLFPFDRATAKTTAGDFVGSLVRACRPLGLISVGCSWSFGIGREGNIHRLKELGAQYNFEVHGVPDVHADGSIVSSTHIRQAVRAADFSRAKALLGRDYTVLGKVLNMSRFNQHGSLPNANIAVENEELPPNGLYSVSVETPDTQRQAMRGVANLCLSSVEGSGFLTRALEARLHDAHELLHGTDMEVAFMRLIRQDAPPASQD